MSDLKQEEGIHPDTVRAVVYLRVSDKSQVERDDTEEGYSIPAQREAGLQLIREQRWSLVDEYCDRGESASKDDDARPQFNAMLQRIYEQGDVDVIVVHKRDRFARHAARHLALRAALRKRGVRLESVVNKLEETAAGWLAEGIEALVNEYHSANLSTEVKKGMRQKAQMGGWIHRPHRLPQPQGVGGGTTDSLRHPRPGARTAYHRGVPALRRRRVHVRSTGNGDGGARLAHARLAQPSGATAVCQRRALGARQSLLRRRSRVRRRGVQGPSRAAR
jgi:DNA invertase Pin-like site-specific DNA recombinase